MAGCATTSAIVTAVKSSQRIRRASPEKIIALRVKIAFSVPAKSSKKVVIYQQQNRISRSNSVER